MSNYPGLLENVNSLRDGHSVNTIPFIRFFSQLILQGHHEHSTA